MVSAGCRVLVAAVVVGCLGAGLVAAPRPVAAQDLDLLNVTLVDGTKYVIAESVPEFIDSVRHYRASLIAQASRLELEPTARDLPDDEQDAKVLPLHRKER